MYNASCLVSIDLACSFHHSHHSHFWAAACLRREAEVEAGTFLQPANIFQTDEILSTILPLVWNKLQGLPHSNANFKVQNFKVQRKLATILKTAELSCI